MSEEVLKLKDVYKDYFKIGTAVNLETLEKDKDLIASQFNSMTAENDMKPIILSLEEEKFNYGPADQIVQFANDNNMGMRGHTLVWHNQTPGWMFKDGDKKAGRELMLSRLEKYIHTTMNHYNDSLFYAWDVVNEAIDDTGSHLLRESPWLDTIGEDYIERSFEFARDANPDIPLFYNDYNESHPHKREKIYKLVKDLIDKEIPVDGIGLQAHWNLEDPHLDDIRRAIEKYASLGLKLHITEMDVSIFNFDDRRKDLTALSPEIEEKQAERYDKFFSIFREYHEHIDSVTLWAVSDRYNWLNDFPVQNRKNWPMLFNETNQPKESFYRVTSF